MGLEEILYLRFANTMLEPIWNRNYVECGADHDGGGLRRRDRGHFYDPVGALRDVVVNHLMQVVAATAMEPPARRDPSMLKDAVFGAFRRSRPPTPRLRPRPVRRATASIAGVAPDSTTETFAALRLDIDNWRW